MKKILISFLVLSPLSYGASICDIANNPANIRFNKANMWEGQTGSYKGFVVFKSPPYGIRAMFKILQKRNGETVAAIIGKHAPASENDTKNYVKFVCKETGLKVNEKIDSDKKRELILIAIARMEGSKISVAQIQKGIALAKK